MTRWVDDFDAAASRCTSLDELKQLIDRAARDLGFDYFALLHHASVGDARRHLIRLDNYPAGWAREFVGNGFAADDPVHLASARVNTGFAWSELNSLIRLGPRQQRILRRSRRYGPPPALRFRSMSPANQADPVRSRCVAGAIFRSAG
jgi:LuxR family quorum-sensing system transcriptional regulator CciR